jgi:hypothetical protein
MDAKPVPQKKASATAVTVQYADPKTSGLTAKVDSEKPNEPIFDLK